MDFFAILKSVERGAKVRFFDDRAQTTLVVGVHYGNEGVLNKLDTAHASLKQVSARGLKLKATGTFREHDLDKQCASYSITIPLLSSEKKAALRRFIGA